MTRTNPFSGPDSFALLKRLLGWMRPYRWRVLWSLLCMALVAAMTALTVWLIKPLLDQGLFANAQTVEAKHAAFILIVRLAVAGLAATVVKSLARYGADYLIGWVGQRVIFDLRLALFSKMQGLSLRFFHDHKTGELLSRIISDVGATQILVSQLFGQAASSIISIVGLSAVLLYLNWKLAVLALLVFPVALWPIRNYGKKLRGISRSVQELTADLAAHLEETLSQMKLVHAYGGADREIGRWRRKLSDQLVMIMRAVRVQARSSPIMETIGAAGFVGLVMFSGYEILISGSTTGGALGAFLGAVLQLYPQVKHLNGLWNNISTGLGAAERIFPILDEPPDITDAAGAVPLGPFKDAVKYANVTFAFRAGEPVLKDISLTARCGTRVAFVGPSGAGKTTIVDLLMRFYDPAEGTITVDGKDIRSVTVSSLRASIALVAQETLLFNASVRDNLLYARPAATPVEMETAARHAGAHEFISTLPEGYDTVIGERGVKLSGGERQRISIARAFLKDAPILILDEATAALDAASEALVQRALDQLMANRTVMVIAHRLATVRRADCILVLDAGRIVESGTHDELHARGGLYRKLCDLQFQEGGKDMPGGKA